MAEQPLRVGDVLHRHYGGLFDRDVWACVRVEGIGSDWVVARTLGTGGVVAAAGPGVAVEAQALRRPDPNCDCNEPSY